jgi:hypothetical protein
MPRPSLQFSFLFLKNKLKDNIITSHVRPEKTQLPIVEQNRMVLGFVMRSFFSFHTLFPIFWPQLSSHANTLTLNPDIETSWSNMSRNSSVGRILCTPA